MTSEQAKKTARSDRTRKDVFSDSLLRRIMRDTAQEIPEPAPGLFHRIEAELPPSPARPARLLQGIMDSLGSIFANPGLGWSLAGLQAAALCLLLLFSPANNGLLTLSSETTPRTGTGQHLYIVFSDTARMKDVRSLLGESRLSIVAGPSKKGVYTLLMPDTADPDSLVKQLKSKPLIRFVERAY